MKKFNFRGLWELIKFITALYIILDSLYKIAIMPYFTGITAQLTYVGLIALLFSFYVAGESYEYIKNRIK